MIEKANGGRPGEAKPGPKVLPLHSMDAKRSPRAVLRRAFENVLVRYAFGVVMAAVAFGLRKVLEPVTATGAPFVLFFGAVVMDIIDVTRLEGGHLSVERARVPAGQLVFDSVEAQAH